jgi:hypothetical protein
MSFKFDEIQGLLNSAVDKSVKEVFHSLLSENELERQKQISKEIDSLKLRAGDNSAPKEADEQEDLPASAGEKKLAPSEEKVIEKLPEPLEPSDAAQVLNIIRSGKSLKDEDVRARFDGWWSALQNSEKIALKAFLDGIAEIITGDVEASEAPTPSKKPYDVRMNVEKKIEKAVVKTDITQSSGTENSPIIVGEVSNTLSERKKMIG